MTKFKWNDEQEKLLIYKREKESKTYRQISVEMGTSIASIKHKYFRLTKSMNRDKYHHPEKKIEQVRKYLTGQELKILELNSGWGNLTREYLKYGKVTSLDIDKERVKYLEEWKEENLEVRQGDSFREIHKEIYNKKKYDVVDLDPYGYPSRYFPHVFELLEDGYLFLTFPKIGVQQINKITIEHLRVFWGLSLSSTERQQEIVDKRLKDYAMQSYRRIEKLSSVDLGRMYRSVYKVKKESALDLVGLKVKGKNY